MKMKEKAEKITCASRPDMNAYNLGLHIFLPARRAENKSKTMFNGPGRTQRRKQFAPKSTCPKSWKLLFVVCSLLKKS